MNTFDVIVSLTPREAEIVDIIIGEGLTDREIAMRLHISHRTVNSHVQNVHAKLGVNSDRQMLAALRKTQVVIQRQAKVIALKENILRLKEQGITPYQIAKRLGVQVNSVYYHAK